VSTAVSARAVGSASIAAAYWPDTDHPVAAQHSALVGSREVLDLLREPQPALVLAGGRERDVGRGGRRAARGVRLDGGAGVGADLVAEDGQAGAGPSGIGGGIECGRGDRTDPGDSDAPRRASPCPSASVGVDGSPPTGARKAQSQVRGFRPLLMPRLST
jgi:hypothetical protein